MSKLMRQKAILDIILNEKIKSQEELIDKLNLLGFTVTQATVSRDIRELSIVKLSDPGSGYHYDIPSRIRDKGKSPEELLKEIFSQAVVSVDFAQNLVVIKCYTGMAQALCAKLDNANFELVVGTIAGDDTVFVALKSEQSAIELVNRLNKYF